MTQGRVTVAVYGAGSIGMRHLRAICELGHEAIAVPVRAGREVPAFTTCATLAEAARSGATAAIIATDTGRHLANAREALALGLDVLIEKPVAPTAAGVAELTREAAKKGRRVAVAYCLRFHEGLTRFRARLPEIGRPHAVRVACQSYLPEWRPDRDYKEGYAARAEEGGVLRDLSHEIDYALWLFGAPRTVFATLHPGERLGIASEEAADLLWTTTAGVSVSVRLDYLTRKSRRVMLVQGERGEIEWNAVEGTVRVSLLGETEETLRVPHDRDAMMQRQLAAFLGGPGHDLLTTLEEATTTILICDAARRSSTTGAGIALDGASA